jgi:hypothetical protein
VEPPSLTVRAIDPIETLGLEQGELLAEALDVRRDLDVDELAVYRMTDGRAVVAPRSGEIGPGSQVVATGWIETWEQADADGNVAELDLAARMVLDSIRPTRLGPSGTLSRNGGRLG